MKIDYQTIADIPADYQLVTDSQDVEAIKNSFGAEASGCGSFFVKVGDGDYESVYGFCGIVPTLTKHVYRVL